MRSVARLLSAAIACTLVVATGCSSARSNQQAQSAQSHHPIVVASFDFAESKLLGEIYAQSLEAHGLEVERELDLGPREFVEPALQQGRVDLVPEYLGTALTFVTAGSVEATSDPALMATRLRRVLAPKGVAVLRYARAQDSNGIVVGAPLAQRYGLDEVSDLKKFASNLVFGGPPECPGRPFCLQGLERVYGLRFKSFRPLDTGGPVTVASLEQAAVDVGVLFTTDPHLLSKRLVLLRDDRHLQPAENVVPVARQAVVDRYGSRLTGAVDAVTSRLTTAGLRGLNRRVQLQDESEKSVAAAWLEAHNLKE